MTELGDGFMLTTIDPNDPEETRDIVIQSAAATHDFDILVGGEDEIMSRRLPIGWSNKFTFEPQAPE
jgi:heptaprenylglyceryl phosphate synthase